MIRRQRAIDLLLQLAVVVAGVTISLGLDEWRSHRADVAEAEQLAQRLRADLVLDLEALDVSTDRIGRMAAAYERLLAPDAASLPDDSLDVYVDYAVSYVLFPPNDEAYEGMRQTGTSALLDADLRADVIRLYTQTYGRTAEWDDINRGFVLERMIPYLEANAPETSARIEGATWIGLSTAFRALQDDVHFRNLLRTNLLFKQVQRTVYDSTTAAVRRLAPQLAE
ncbi:hypothetical protein [Rubrivirga sp.]|uniref:hypothetical protein n=1 Tax=Rubrivirga sp. TaxID=1885344 RepID=UPI003B52317B